MRRQRKHTDSVTGPLLTETTLELLEKENYEDAVTLLSEAVQRDVTSVETLYNYDVASFLLLFVNSASELALDAIFTAFYDDYHKHKLIFEN